MRLKIRKITRTSAVYGVYVWQVRCVADDLWAPSVYAKSALPSSVGSYLVLKQWCLETFGDSVDYQLFFYRDEMLADSHFNTQWCYQAELNARKFCIYLSDEAMSLFKLKWN